MRGVINIATRQEICRPLESPNDPGVSDPEWLSGFENSLDQYLFIRSRQSYWRMIFKQHDPHAQPRAKVELPVGTNFILYAKGKDNKFAVFEDDGTTGYLYLYHPVQHRVIRHLHLYDRSSSVEVYPEDVRVLWSSDMCKCGVVIWNKIRGIIDLSQEREGRVWLENRNTPGIGDRDWLNGFET
jgi:hypothetical protein